MHLCDIKNKIALVRVNYDLPNISEKSRILDSKKTVDQLLSKNNKVVLVSHWGRPSSFESELSMERLKDILVEVFNEEVLYINQYEYFNQKTNDLRVLIENSREKIILLENTRFVKSEKGEKAERMELAKKYSQIADVFVDEAFAVSHRKEATNYEIKELMKTCYGFSYLNEKTNLDEFKLSKKHPKYVIMGGAKLETKLQIIEKVLPIMDKVFICGVLCYTFIQAQNQLGGEFVDIKDSPVDIEFLETATEIMKNFGEKIILPFDLVFGENDGRQVGLDIGPRSLDLFQKELDCCGQIFWNGPLGQYEIKPYELGTIKLAEILTNLKNTKIYIGGGDTVSVIPSEIQQKFDFISMGGGATLEYLIS